MTVADIERRLERYERLREKAGVDHQLLEEAARLLPGPLAPIQVVAEVLLGAIPAECSAFSAEQFPTT